MKNNTILSTLHLLCFFLLSTGIFAQTVGELKTAIGDYKRTFYQVSCKSTLLDSQLVRIEKIDYTVVKKCSICNGKGKVTSKISCGKCDGSGMEICMRCYGNGSTGCTNCKNTGKVFCPCATETLSDILLKSHHYKVNCGICGGSNGGRGQLNCSACSGRGNITCSNCEGSGKNTCTNCRGNGDLTAPICCDDCKGMGRLVE